MKRLNLFWAVALTAGVTLAVAPAVGASAHDYLISSTPSNKSVVTDAVTSVSLTFNDVIIDLSGAGGQNLVYVTGPAGATSHFETGCASVLGRTISAPVALGDAGIYTLAWRIVSSDGHPVTSSITFDYEPSTTAATTVSLGTPTSTCTAAAAASGTTASDGTLASSGPQQGASDSSNTAQPLADIWWLVIGFVAIVVLALLTWLVVAFLRRH